MQTEKTRESMTEDVFPEIDSMLKDPDFSNSILLIRNKSDGIKYRSGTDLVLCELIPSFKKECRKYYAGKGPKLSGRLTDVQRAACVFSMKVGLVQALLSAKEGERCTWRGIRTRVVEQINSMR